MPAGKQYTVLHEFDTRVNEDTGEEKKFFPGDTYDGPEKTIKLLLAGHDDKGPLIAVKSSDEARSAVAESKEN